MFQKISLISAFTIALLCAGSLAQAKTEEFNTKQGQFNLDVPNNWKHLEEFLGVPVTLLSPMGPGDQRAVISITPYGVTDKDDMLKKFPKDPEEYVRQKEDWLEGVDGASLSYDSFHEENNKDKGSTIYSIGMSYSIPTGKFHQQSFYISDNHKHIYYVTAMIPLAMDDQTKNIVKEVARSIASVK